MAKQNRSEQLDAVITAALARPSAGARQANEGLAALARIASDLRDLPRQDFKARLKADLERRAAMTTGTGRAVNPIREGFHSITPYLIISGAAQWIEFAKQAFGAEERIRVERPGTNILMHAEVKIGDSMIELADANEQFPAQPGTLWLRVDDVDAVYNRAVEAGATPLLAPADQSYDSRDGSVRDLAGNVWYIFTPKPGSTGFAGLHSINPYMHPAKAPQLIEFLEKAFGADEVYRAQSPEGTVHHAQVRVGDSIIGMGDAHGPYQPRPCTLHLYVPDADAVYARALRAGATSVQAVADQPYGDRSGGVEDPFGNRWFIATHIRD
jgi:PhnB protein